MIFRRTFAPFIWIPLITIGLAASSEPRAQDFTVQPPSRMAPGMRDNETVREVVLAEDRGPTEIRNVLSVLRSTTLAVAAIAAVIGLFVFILVASERASRRSRGPVSILGGLPAKPRHDHCHRASKAAGDSTNRRR
jgi:hypothetical protein